MNRLSIAAVLPHLRVFGGIRRYLSLGQMWTDWGHEVVLYTPDGAPATWLPFAGTVRSFRELGDRPHDVALTPQPALLGALARIPTSGTRGTWQEPGAWCPCGWGLSTPDLKIAYDVGRLCQPSTERNSSGSNSVESGSRLPARTHP